MNNVYARTTYCLVTGMKIHNSESLSQEEAADHSVSYSKICIQIKAIAELLKMMEQKDGQVIKPIRVVKYL